MERMNFKKARVQVVRMSSGKLHELYCIHYYKLVNPNLN